MFRIHDYALSDSEIHLLESCATVYADKQIVFPGWYRRHRQIGSFNLCEILLEWHTQEHYGVQRIRLGRDTPITSAKWKRALYRRVRAKALLERVVWSRRISIRACFPHETVKFRTLGWRLMNVEFFVQGKNAVKIDEAHDARITQVFVQCLDASSSPRGAKLQ